MERLHHRFGLRRKATLDEIGKDLGVTRERVRQIERRAKNVLESKIDSASVPLSVLESSSPAMAVVAVGATERAAVIHEIAGALTKNGLHVDNAKSVYQLLVLLRAVPERAGATWPRMTLLACSLAPEVSGYEPVARLLEAKAEANRKLSYPELARLVLLEAGVPLHWREVVARAEALGRKETVAPGSMMNAMQESSTFVRTSSGTYGLREWGLQTKQPNTTLVAEFLAARGRPASFGEILQKVGTSAQIKPNSLQMALDLSPRFYRSVEDEYGLRAWLPPRDMQRLSTPRWKVEAADSFARVERAEEKGYDVEAIVLKDIERGIARD